MNNKEITISIMQPYFFPYLGYFRLLLSDIFVIYDCVQFTRRGRIHRNEFIANNNKFEWLTLPIKKPDFHSKIYEVVLKDNYQEELKKRISKFKNINYIIDKYPEIKKIIFSDEKHINKYLGNHFKYFSNKLNFNSKIFYSSNLNIDTKYKGENRIIEICKLFKAQKYINVEGGIKLYNKDKFLENNIELKFLKPYKDYQSILDLLVNKPFIEIEKNIKSSNQYFNDFEIINYER
jgi:hypothetical protein